MTAYERISAVDVASAARAAFALEVLSATRLDTERDDSFHLVTSGGEFSLKIAHPDDTAALIDLQSSALAHAAASGLSLQRVVATAVINDRVARLLTWLPGTPLFETQIDDAQLANLGRTLGTLSTALTDFDHPLARRPFAWDALQLPAIEPLKHLVSDPAIDEGFALFERRVAPVLAELPKQVTHNDFHPGNILIDGERVSVIDFGDVVCSARVADLAIALSYLVTPLDRDSAPFVRGFEELVPLEPIERQVLPALVIARLVQRILINADLARGNPDNRSALATGTNLAALRTLLDKDN